MDVRVPASIRDRNLEEFHRAAVVVQRRWKAKQYKKQFDYLKHAICVAELSLSKDMVRILNPAEKELLKDPAIHTKIKIRFGGATFPPIVLFKVYTSMAPKREGWGCEEAEPEVREVLGRDMRAVAGRGGRIQYINGLKMITPHSKAAEDALRQMGGKQYRHQVAQDSSRQQQLKITEVVDVTSVKDYMLYMSNTDESPAYLGGKDNTWRRLDLSAWHRPDRTCTVDFYKTRRFRADATPTSGASRGADREKSSESRRNSRQAMRRADQMRTLYCRGRDGEEEEKGASASLREKSADEEDDLDEQAAYDMIQWSQNLNYSDI